MKIRWIGQSGYIIRSRYAEIVIDPYLSNVVNKVADRPRMVEAPIKPEDIQADVIVCTHHHLDHMDPDAINLMARNQFFATTSSGAKVLKDMGFVCVKSMQIGECIQVNDVEIQAVYAAHTVDAFGVILRAEGKVLYFSGDTLFDEKIYEIASYKPDVTFICINGKLGNMNVDEAVLTAKHIGAKRNVPNHYGMFASNTEDPEKFTKQMHNGFIMEFNVEYDIDELVLKEEV